MIIDLSSIDREQFVVRDCDIAGDDCALVFPSHLGVDWTSENLHLRSLIFRKSDGRILSRGHDKFFNHLEKPGLYPDPTSFNDWHISTKLDGSLIIVSMHRNEMIVRTRGTTTVDVYETGAEVRRLLADFGASRWLDIRDTLHSNSLLFEHCTPANRIVVSYDKPSLTLLDVIAHDETGYWSAKQVDQMALCLCCARPDTHSFGSLEEIAETLKTLQGMEGYVLSYNDNRNRVKLKAEDYLLHHRMKSAMASRDSVMDYWFSLTPRPVTLEEFFTKVESSFDHEVAKTAVPHMCRVLYASDQVRRGLDMTRYLVERLKSLSRKEAALDIQSRHHKWYRPAAFMYLSNREPDDKTVRRLMENVLDEKGESVKVTP